MKKTIILLSSRLPQQGKDTVGEYLINNYGFKRYAFADRVKQIATESFGWDGKKDERGRKLLINVGTITGREYNKNIWIDYIIESIRKNKDDFIVITDCRFVNEYTQIANADYGEDYKVISIGIDSIMRGDKSFENDESQIEFKKIHKDFLIMNDYSIKALQDAVGAIMISHIGGTK